MCDLTCASQTSDVLFHRLFILPYISGSYRAVIGVMLKCCSVHRCATSPTLPYCYINPHVLVSFTHSILPAFHSLQRETFNIYIQAASVKNRRESEGKWPVFDYGRGTHSHLTPVTRLTV